MTTGLIDFAAPLLFNPFFIGFTIVLFLICCAFLIAKKGPSLIRFLMGIYVIICILFFAFLIWCIVAFGSNATRESGLRFP